MEPVKTAEFEKTYDAPLAQVWQAWTEAERLKQWWGPDNVSIPECEVDLREGGRLYIVMEAGEAMGPYKGTRWPMEAKYTAIQPQKRLAYTAKAWTEGADESQQIDQLTDVTFSEKDGKTTVTIKVEIYRGPEAALQGMKYGFAQQLAKLDKFLASKK